jgi:hypothetical protein
MALQNLQQYGCQTGNELKEKSRDLNRNSSRNKNETMFGRGYENYPVFGVLGGVSLIQSSCRSFIGVIVPYENSKVNFRVETKILVSMSEEI